MVLQNAPAGGHNLAEAEPPVPEGLEGYADETRLHYAGGLSETEPGVEPLEPFDAE